MNADVLWLDSHEDLQCLHDAKDEGTLGSKHLAADHFHMPQFPSLSMTALVSPVPSSEPTVRAFGLMHPIAHRESLWICRPTIPSFGARVTCMGTDKKKSSRNHLNLVQTLHLPSFRICLLSFLAHERCCGWSGDLPLNYSPNPNLPSIGIARNVLIQHPALAGTEHQEG